MGVSAKDKPKTASNPKGAGRLTGAQSVARAGYSPTEKMCKAICERLERGWSIDAACGSIRLPVRIFHAWMTIGERDDAEVEHKKEFVFANNINASRSKLEGELADLVMAGAEVDPNSAKWLLQNLFCWNGKQTASYAAKRQLERLQIEKLKADIELVKARTETIMGGGGDPAIDAFHAQLEELNLEKPARGAVD
jgi:hypothetical protein